MNDPETVAGFIDEDSGIRITWCVVALSMRNVKAGAFRRPMRYANATWRPN